jgi:hypothetical protein
MQKNFTGIIEGRVDKRSLATLYKWFLQNNVAVRTKSALVNEIVETLKNVVVENNLVKEVISIQEADDILVPLATAIDRKVAGNLAKAIRMEVATEVSEENLRAICEEGVRKFEEMMSKNTDVSRAEGIVQLSEEARKVPDYSNIPAGIVATTTTTTTTKEGE